MADKEKAKKRVTITMEDPAAAPAATATAAKSGAACTAPKTDEGIDCIHQPSSAPPAPPIQEEGGGEGKASPSALENPFDQYYSQLTHQQNMLQDSVRVTAYQRAILENAADFKVRLTRESRGSTCQSVFPAEVSGSSPVLRGEQGGADAAPAEGGSYH